MSVRVAAILAVPEAVAEGASQDISEYETFTIYVSGTFVATIDLEVSPDPRDIEDASSEWIAVETGLAPGQFVVPDHAMKVRANTTAYTSGTPIVKIVGQRI